MFLLIILGLLGVAAMFFGAMLLNGNFAKKYLRWTNELKGVKTEITSTTLAYLRFTGIGLIIFGLAFALLGFYFFVTFPKI